MNIIETIKSEINTLPENSNSWVFAYSGGVDSCVMTDIVSKLKPDHISLKLIHVNHGLGQKEASLWAEQARLTAEKIGAEFITTEFNMDETKSGIEEEARQLRYDFITSHLNEGDVLFMGHHKNDQAETILFRLFRGTGVRGLTGIPKQRPIGKGLLFRPMLNVSRQDIYDYAINHNIHWYEDDSNVDTQFSRNFLRHDVLPLIQSRWGKLLDHLSALSGKAAEMHELCIEIATEDFNRLSYYNEIGDLSIDCDRLQELSVNRQKNLVSYILESKLNINQESKTFKNTLQVLLKENKCCSKVRRLELKNTLILNNGKTITIQIKKPH